jgi:hypothetical protein
LPLTPEKQKPPFFTGAFGFVGWVYFSKPESSYALNFHSTVEASRVPSGWAALRGFFFPRAPGLGLVAFHLFAKVLAAD